MGGNSTLRTPGFGQKRKKKSLILMPDFTLKAYIDRWLTRGSIGYLKGCYGHGINRLFKQFQNVAPPRSINVRPGCG
jgi:hypothetical protein